MTLERLKIFEKLALFWLELPYFPFQKRIIKIIRKNKTIMTDVYGAKIESFVGDHISDNLLVQGVYEPLSLKLALSLVSEGDVCVDVGANIGLYSVLLPLKTGCKVIAFEPNHTTFQVLRRNVVLNNLSELVVAIPCALSKTAGVVEISLGSPGNVGGASMIRPGAHMNFSPSLPLSIVLDDLKIDQVKFLKLDVEGAEDLVLSGVDLGIVHNIIMEWIGTGKTSKVKEFINSNIYKKHFENFDVLDVQGRSFEDIDSFVEYNVYLRKRRNTVKVGQLIEDHK